jgi:adenylate cyclase
MSGFRRAALEFAGRLRAGVGAALVVVAFVSIGYVGPLEKWSLEPVEKGWFDRLFELRGARAPRAPIVIVTVDDSSFSQLDTQWPFPRAMHGTVIDRISAGRPLAIAIDMLFDTKSSRGPRDDKALGAAVARAGNVVLGAMPISEGQDLYAAPGTGYRLSDPNLPILAIRSGAAAYAAVQLPRDSDGHVRRGTTMFVARDATLTMPTFDAAIYGVVARAGFPAAPLPSSRTFIINFRGRPKTFTWIPYSQVLRGEVEPKTFSGKIVLIGPTADIFHDVFPTPFSRNGLMPGVELHANAIETLLSGNAIREIPQWASTLLAVVVALIGALLVVRLRALRAFFAALGLWLALALAVVWVFALLDVWLRSVAFTVAVVLGYGATVVEHFVREQREKRRLSRFFSADVLRAVLRDKDERKSLGASRRLVTVLFSDLRGFTSISEKLPPEQIVEMLREYLTEMTEIVFKNGGTVDKYIGDCVMALYNVPFEDPEHAIRAVRTGLEFQESTLAAAERWQAKYGVSIRNGVGINTGEAIVGTLGSQKIFQYTAIGDTVNLAARLESITKDYHASIIISESTYEYVKDKFPTRGLGEVTVKGKTVPVKIFAVLPPDIRKYPRAALDAGAALTNAATGQICQVRTRDISEGGLALAGVPADWTIGSKVEIKIDGGDLLKPIIAEGTIAWRRGDDAGINFTQVESDSVTEYVAGRGRKGV